MHTLNGEYHIFQTFSCVTHLDLQALGNHVCSAFLMPRWTCFSTSLSCNYFLVTCFGPLTLDRYMWSAITCHLDFCSCTCCFYSRENH